MSGPDPAIVWLRIQEWMRHAAEDERIARGCLQFEPPSFEGAAFHCQQAVEKLLKGFLVRANIDFRKTHDLDALGQSVAARFPSVAPLLPPLQEWTAWGVAYRYPDETKPLQDPSIDELSLALTLITRLTEILRALGPP